MFREIKVKSVEYCPPISYIWNQNFFFKWGIFRSITSYRNLHVKLTISSSDHFRVIMIRDFFLIISSILNILINYRKYAELKINHHMKFQVFSLSRFEDIRILEHYSFLYLFEGSWYREKMYLIFRQRLSLLSWERNQSCFSSSKLMILERFPLISII